MAHCRGFLLPVAYIFALVELNELTRHGNSRRAFAEPICLTS